MFRDLVDDLDDFSVEPEILLDVPFVPTDSSVIQRILDLGEISAKDLVYDLGSGDGRILITAARERGARGVGIEIDPLRVADAMEDAAHYRVEHLVDFVEESIYTADFSNATVVTMYLLESINFDLRPRLLSELRPGTRVISHCFHMGDWKADEEIELSSISIYKWIIPAQVAGAWEWDSLDDQRYYVELEQKYQEVTGNAWLGDDAVELISASLVGDSLELQIRDDENATPRTFTLIFGRNELLSVFEES